MSSNADKTEEPTPRRLRKAREQGDTPVSGAAVQTGALLAAVVLLPAAAGLTIAGFNALLSRALSPGSSPLQTSPFEVLVLLLMCTAPILAASATAALAIGFVQTQGQLSFSKFAPNFANLDPISGLSKLFKLERLFQVARAAVLAATVTWLSVDLVSNNLGSLVAVTGRLETAGAFATILLKQLLWLTVGVSVALAALDILLTRRAWLVRNRMSKDEVKREYKESEGDPHIKQERRRAHQEMLNNTSLLALKDASVLIVNPTHLATALSYDDQGEGAPKIVAKGQGALARQLMDAARAYGIPIVRDVPVARALHELELGDEIPEALYEAVAEILREVWEQSERAPS